MIKYLRLRSLLYCFCFYFADISVPDQQNETETAVQQIQNKLVDDGDFREPLHYPGSDSDEGISND